ncbi:MAG: sugar phosphate isomerase/epimerase, partial [Promethearchaeota archaeon]
MELGISSIAYINDNRTLGEFNTPFDILLDSSEKALTFAEENDLKICEFLWDPPSILIKEEGERFMELCNDYQAITKQIHAPYSDVNLASHNQWNRRASVECYADLAHICKKIGASIYTIHPGSSRYLQGYNKAINTANLLLSVRELLDRISGLSITTCIENMQKKTGILLDLKECEDFFNRINRQDIYFTWDTSHSWTCSVDVEELWKNLHSYIKNVHIVDNTTKSSDTHPALGSGVIDFQEIFDIVSSYNYNGAMIIEI